MTVTAPEPTPREGDLMLVSEVPADRQPAAVYLARLGAGSRRTMRGALDTIAALLTGGAADARSLDWGQLRYQHTAAVRAVLAERYAPATANRMLAALRGVLKEAWRLGYIDAEAYQRAADLPGIRSQTLPRGRALTSGELAALMGACGKDPSTAGARDGAMLALMYGAGLRRSEVVALDVTDHDPESGALTLRQAKGRKDRLVYATNGSADALADWLLVRGPAPGPLFLPIDKAGHIGEGRLSSQAVYHVIERRARGAGVARFSPHDLRRTTITHLLEAGADIVTVQRLAGHAQVTTTARYDRRGEAEKKKKAAELLHVPYRRRAAGAT